MKRIYVKPIRKDADQWIVFEGNPFQDFIDDVRRFGILTALHNLIWQIRNR